MTSLAVWCVLSIVLSICIFGYPASIGIQAWRRSTTAQGEYAATLRMIALHLVEPLGFRIDDRELKRAGLDYWESLDVVVHASLDAALSALGLERTWLFSTRAARRAAISSRYASRVRSAPASSVTSSPKKSMVASSL